MHLRVMLKIKSQFFLYLTYFYTVRVHTSWHFKIYLFYFSLLSNMLLCMVLCWGVRSIACIGATKQRAYYIRSNYRQWIGRVGALACHLSFLLIAYLSSLLILPSCLSVLTNKHLSGSLTKRCICFSQDLGKTPFLSLILFWDVCKYSS